jgi:putative peptidoglycan lipid II flippase
VLKSTLAVGLATALSRVLGFVREMLMAALFGTSLAQSAFVVAFRIPNLFRRLLGEGALASAFVPVFTESLERDGPERAWKLAGRVTTLLGLVLAVVVAASILGVSAVIRLVPASPRLSLVLDLLRIMLPYAWFVCMAALCMAILNSFHCFLLPASTPVVLNLVWIAALALVCPGAGRAPEERIYPAAWAIVLAGLAQWLVQVPTMRRYGFRARPAFDWRSDPRVGRILVLMGPAALGLGITQVNVLMDSVLAMWIGRWAPAALAFAERLLYLPLGLFATAMGTVLLPVFSGQAARSRPDQILATLSQSLRLILFVMVPASVGLMVLSGPIVELVYERGAFTGWSTTLTARALACYAPGLAVFSLQKVFVPAFYALQDTRTPVRVGMRCVALNFCLNVLFMLTWPLYFRHSGLACATVLAEATNAAALGWMLHRRLGSPGWRQIARGGLAALLGSAAMGAAAMLAYAAAAGRVAAAGLGGSAGRAAALAAAVAAGCAVYAAAARLLCRDEWNALRGRLARRIRGAAAE